MAYISKRNRKKEKEKQTAADNRRELIAAGFKRRDLLKMGLLTSAGMLINESRPRARGNLEVGDGPLRPSMDPPILCAKLSQGTIFLRALQLHLS